MVRTSLVSNTRSIRTGKVMDRQDIDALLIGALYGELTPADEARLSAHLDTHPADRGALEDLKITRQSVLESRIFAVVLEPPQAVSALLLQEAHRRAPKRVVAASEQDEGGWFYRFTRSFLAHPAMAAAAMLVLVLGGAGIAYMKNGDQFAAKQGAAPSMEAEATVASGSAAAAPAPMAAGDTAEFAAESGSAINAGLYEPAAERAAEDSDTPADTRTATASASDRWEAQQQATSERKKAPSRGIIVSTSKGSLKELGAPAGKNDAFGFDDAPAAGLKGGGRAAGTGAIGHAGAMDGAYAQPPPPPMASAAAPSKATKATAAPRAPEAKPAPELAKDKAPAAAPPQVTRRDDATLAWAKGEHQRAVSLAQNGECGAAAKVALGVSSRAGDYYAQVMATDRALKQCAAYINAERDREAERSGKARAQKRTNADESAPTQTK